MQSKYSSARSQTRRRTIVMTAALAGMFGPVLFVTVLIALTALQYDFMLRIGWHPLADPAGAWPSGLALGPYGALQDVTFVVSGLLLALFSVGLSIGTTGGRSSPLGPALLFMAGIAMTLMGFETDRYRGSGPGACTAWFTTQPSCSSSWLCWWATSLCGEGSGGTSVGAATPALPLLQGSPRYCCFSCPVQPTICLS